MVANHPSGFFDLAAAPRQPLAVAAWPTSPRKTRVRGFRRHASGQTSSRRRCRSIITPGLRGCGYKIVSGRHEWPNHDPLGEPGFETLHLASQPLFTRKLRLGINDSEMQFLLASAMQSGSLDVSSYLRNSQTHYAGSTISALAFLNILRSGQGTYAPNWPAELLEYPNLYEYVGNDPLDGIDPFGLKWYNPSTWEWPEALWIAIETGLDDAGAAIGKGAVECAHGIYGAAPDIQHGNQLKYQLENGNSNGVTNGPNNTITAD